ncbi:MAG: hypothetical protein HW405_459, partial [Candidatus Berkelbacteria bacterium]|nr:hypothetical protein [Candidatus Berkelbacteria bacterium]
ITVSVSWPSSSGIQLTDYFTRHKNSLWEQTDWSGGGGQAVWQSPPGNKYFSVTTNSVPAGDINSTVSGQLQLAKIPAGTTNRGNKFITTSLTSIGRLNASNLRDSMRFTAQKNGTVNQVRVYVNEVQRGNQVTYRYGIQGDLSGNPSGIYLGSGTASLNTTGWQTVNLTSSATINVGTTYHLVIQYDSGSAPAGNRYINFQSTLPNNNLIPKNDVGDASATTLHYNGASWTTLSQQPIYVMRFTDITYEGNPYDNFANRNIRGANFEGEAFTVANDTLASGVGLYVAASNNNQAADNLYVTLEDVTAGGNLVNETFITPAQVTTTFVWIDHNFVSNVTLPAGHLFRLYFSSPGSNLTRNYLIVNESNPNLPEYIALNWSGTDAVTTRSTNSGVSFSDLTYVDLSYYLKIAANDTHAPWGELISSTLDTANLEGGGLNKISWATVGALPVGTTVRMQLAANNDNSTWSWTGPSGSGTWYTTSAGEYIWADLYSALASQPARYIRYKIRLETSDQLVTPKVDYVRVNWAN